MIAAYHKSDKVNTKHITNLGMRLVSHWFAMCVYGKKWDNVFNVGNKIRREHREIPLCDRNCFMILRGKKLLFIKKQTWKFLLALFTVRLMHLPLLTFQALYPLAFARGLLIYATFRELKTGPLTQSTSVDCSCSLVHLWGYLVCFSITPVIACLVSTESVGSGFEPPQPLCHQINKPAV